MPEIVEITTFKKAEMKKTFLLVAALWLAFSGFGQRTLDLGLWGGTTNYFGDLEGVKHFQSFNPVGGIFARYNFNTRVSLRATGLFGKIAAEGSLFDVTQPTLNKTFQDISLQGEVNYLRYIFGEKKTPFSSYISGGLAMLHYDANTDGINVEKATVFTPALAIGFGFKLNVGERMAVGIEYQLRKLFDDSLDDIADPYRHTNVKGVLVEYTDSWHNNDWVTYLGLHLTYVLDLTPRVCPVYEKKK